MAINFPSNPSLNDTFTSGGVVFIWNGSSWSSSTVSEISNDATPRLGGDLDVDGNTIEGTGDINLSGIVTATSANFSGNVSIGGVLTYEDVTNVDSVGLITARNGIDATGTVTATTFSGSGSSLTSLNASQLSSGTVPDARFPSVLPAVSGANLTNLDASDLASGTIPDARFPATLPAVSGTNLTNLDASDLSSGTLPDARFPATLPAVSGANLTNLPDNVASWTLGADGTSNYTFSGPGLTGAENDPTIYLQRGVTYKFVNNMNAHPFRIQSTPNGSTGTQYNDGITNNDVSNGTLEWDVQFDAPDELYYQCTAHANMGGKIIIGGGGESWGQLDTWLYG